MRGMSVDFLFFLFHFLVRAADRSAHPRVGGIAPCVAIELALGMPLRLPTANECRRADGPASIGTCENSGSPPPPALVRSPHAAPPPTHSLPPHAHAAARK